MEYGSIKKTQDGWVVEYYDINKLFEFDEEHAKVTGPTKVSRPKRRVKREVLTMPVHKDSIRLCVEGEEVEFNVEDGLAKIILYQPKPHSDRLIGWLVGEIIWCRKLMMFTEDSLIETMVTPEEKAEYERLNNVWFAGGRYGKNTITELLHKQDWENYRTYARALHIKYMPHEIEHSELVGYDITDVAAFARGIEEFLWNTDHCCYTFTKEDIEIRRMVGMHSNLFKIKFKLDYLVDSNN